MYSVVCFVATTLVAKLFIIKAAWVLSNDENLFNLILKDTRKSKLMDTTFHFMVDFTLPNVLSSDFMDLIPEQKSYVDQLLAEGTLINYMLSLDDAKLWAVFSANSEYDVMQMIAELPLTQFMDARISQLTMHNTQQKSMPVFSMN